MILIIFASKTNKPVYDKVASYLKENKADFELRICSAHKTPKELLKILEKDYSVIIAGAGMAAHLAGVIAAKKNIPVIGVPCSDNFEGLDALLSTLQMPPGIPVLSVGVDCAEEAAEAAIKISQKPKKVYINVRIKHAEKAADYLCRLNVPYELSYSLIKEGVNIRFVELSDIKNQKKEKDLLIVNVPVSEKKSSSDAIKLLDIKYGLWTSLNRADNAAIASAQIVGKTAEVEAMRKEFADAVNKADMEERNANKGSDF